MVKGRVVEDLDRLHPDGDPSRPHHPWSESVLYELHLKGFTIRHPEVHEGYRGTFAGLSAKAVADYLKALGITAIELMPVQAFVHDRHLVMAELSNYWGYSPLNFFAPHTGLSGQW